jgi:protein-disulfide isomerase
VTRASKSARVYDRRVPAPPQAPLTPDDHLEGHEGAPFLLLMYGDFECPFCQAAQSILARVRKRLGEDVRFAYRHFPLDTVHPLAREAAEVAEAAAAQGAFWPMHDALYDLRGRLERPAMLKAAKKLSLDTARIETELDAHVHLPRIDADVASGERSGVTGTPAFFANGELVSGSFDAGSLVDALRAAAP